MADEGTPLSSDEETPRHSDEEVTADPDRIVSLAPSATEIVRELGAGDALVGVTHHCEADAPPVGGWLDPDYEAVADRDPDVVLTADGLQAEVAADLRERGHEVVHLAPGTLDEAVESFAQLGRAVGRPAAGTDLARRARDRLDRVRRRVSSRDSPVVYCEEWSDPPMAAGNWVPEAVATAGGRYPFADPGDRSREVSRSEVEDAAPDHVVLHVCGHGDRTDSETVTERDWDLPAIDRENVHVFDDSLLNQPSPRLVEGVELLAETLHPDAFDA